MTTGVRQQLPVSVQRLYTNLEERVLERDQVGASQQFYEIVRAGRPLLEQLRETVRIHAPYTHMPYHERMDNGVVRFVNNDHCLLSARTSLALPRLLGPEYEFLPLAQTTWYLPTGLDPWNQLQGGMPGHYARNRQKPGPDQKIPPPEVHFEDTEPAHLEGTVSERINTWHTLVQRGDVPGAYRVFLGLLELEEHRGEVLGALVFAGLIDVQDRMLFNRSYTTGHKAYRARATVELGSALGWEDAGAVVYAGVPDIAVGPRWYSSYEMAGEVVWNSLAEDHERQRSSLDTTPELPPERRLLDNDLPLSSAESAMLVRALIHDPEPSYIEAIPALLLAGKSPLAIVDALQIAAAMLVLQTSDERNFSMPQHAYEYTNTLAWFFEHFDHPHRIKLLYVAGSFINQCARWLDVVGRSLETRPLSRRLADLPPAALLEELGEALVRRAPGESVALTRAYLEAGAPRAPLVRTLALAAVKHGNDPHNQELGLCFLEDYGRTSAEERDMLLLGCAQHTAGHIKYGDSLEAFRRFSEAVGVQSEGHSDTGRDPAEALLDD